MPRHTCEHKESQHKRTYVDIQYTANREGRLTQYKETHCVCFFGFSFFVNLNQT